MTGLTELYMMLKSNNYKMSNFQSL